jgi:luciferase family oxidoreductase group 1
LRRGLQTSGDDYPELLEELRGYLAKPRPGQTVHAFPGEGMNIPIYLLGSSGFSAHLAGTLGLPFAFAAHFQPEGLFEALALYRNSFRSSDVLKQPYAMAGIPVLVADTDAKARYLATTAQQMFLNLIRNQPVGLMPPREHLDWNAFEQAAVESRFRAAIVGSPETVRTKLEDFLAETQVDELIIATNTYEHADRLRSYQLLADVAATAKKTSEVVVSR